MNILITGGASGLGEAITQKLLLTESNRVWFTYHRSAENAAVITSANPRATAIQCDFSNAAEIDTLIAEMANMDLDVLVNNAYSGQPIKDLFHKIPAADFADGFLQDVMPCIKITQAAIHAFRKKKHGQIISILSAYMGSEPPSGTSVYVAGKAYLEQLTKVWARENVKFNIRANAVSPTFMLTGLTKDVDERLVEQMIENHPQKRLLTTAEVAVKIDSLLYDSVTGENILINPGSQV